ncbi:uncharacterized protein LOC134357695 [Mobula hypostoma]|uniref:uncharacterized protein LOC134357695 n=1 Tax=Mobula hypostoma TaxID=723540 RepID=UPI002FC2A69E
MQVGASRGRCQNIFQKGESGRTLKTCVNQLVGVFKDIFDLSLLHSEVPKCFKRASITPVPVKSRVSCLNDYHPFALTSTVMKCFERLVMARKKSCLSKDLDFLQFAYCHSSSTVDATSLPLHSALNCLDNGNTSVRLLFIGYSSVFNTIMPSILTNKLQHLGVSTSATGSLISSLGNHQSVQVRNNIPSLLITLAHLKNVCLALCSTLTAAMTEWLGRAQTASVNLLMTTMVGRISDGGEVACMIEIDQLVEWCCNNNLALNVSQTEEMIVEFRKGKSREHTPVLIEGSAVEKVSGFKILVVNISEDQSWLNTLMQLR